MLLLSICILQNTTHNLCSAKVHNTFVITKKVVYSSGIRYGSFKLGRLDVWTFGRLIISVYTRTSQNVFYFIGIHLNVVYLVYIR